MSLTPQRLKIDLPPQTRRSTWRIDFEVLNADGTDYDFTGVKVLMAFRANVGGANVLELDNEAGGDLTTTAGNIRLELDSVQTDIAAETYLFDGRFEKDGDSFVYFGGSQRVIENISEPTPPST